MVAAQASVFGMLVSPEIAATTSPSAESQNAIVSSVEVLVAMKVKSFGCDPSSRQSHCQEQGLFSSQQMKV